jgi:hypothetical protein
MLFIEKLKKNILSKSLPVILLGILSGCSNLPLKEETAPPASVKEVVQQVSLQPRKDVTPAWISSLVADLNSKPVKDSPESISQFLYNGRVVYYFAPACCGKMSNLYDEKQNIICRPDGGEDGKGDGKCPGFMAERKNEKLIWAENRD